MKNIIQDKRKKMEMTQLDLATLLNVSDKTVSRWETGATLPDVEMIPKLSKVLNVSIEELYGELSDFGIDKPQQVNNLIISNFKIGMIVAYIIYFLSIIFFGLSADMILQNDSSPTTVILFVILASLGWMMLVAAIIIGIIFFVKYKRLYSEKTFNAIYHKWDILFFVITYYILLASLITLFGSMFKSSFYYPYGNIFIGVSLSAISFFICEKYANKHHFLIIRDKKALITIIVWLIVFVYMHYFLTSVIISIFAILFLTFSQLFIALRIRNKINTN